MQQFIVFFSFIFAALPAFAQEEKVFLSGRIIDKELLVPLPDAQLFFPQLKQIFGCDSNGIFVIKELPMGIFSIHVFFHNELVDSFKADLSSSIIELGDIGIDGSGITQKYILAEQFTIPVMVPEADPEQSDAASSISNPNISVLLNASGTRDPFLNALRFVFGQYNFHPRGYNRPDQQVFINGILMNDLHTGYAIWAQWSGLNDVFKNQNGIYGLAAGPQSLGGINGCIAFDAAATEQAAQNKITYSLSDRSYNNRIMLTHSSGLSKRQWAYTFSASRRWAKEGYVPGTSFDGYSGFVSLGKVLNARNQVSISMIAAAHTRARSGAATEEVYRLADDKYCNPNWGWQNGEKRNARIAKIFQPTGIIQYLYNPNAQTQMTTSCSFQSGRSQISSLDWYNAIDPRPDYYRNLPGYYQNSNTNAAAAIMQTLVNNPDKLQLDWARFYNANSCNAETIQNLNGNAGSNLKGNRSLYVTGADVEQTNKVALAYNIQHKQSAQLSWSGGLQFIYQKTTCFRELIDLLGGDYFVNYNMFAAQQYSGNNNFEQHDLNTPDRAVKPGEKYRYHYINTINKGWAWGQAEADFKKVTFFAAFKTGYTTYSRDGQYRNGIFTTNSFGKSDRLQYVDYSVKAGVTYKLNGRNYLVLNGMLRSEDPGIHNIFIAPRIRNQTTEDAGLQQTQSMELAYLMRAPRCNMRILGYATDILNSTTIQRFYNDDPEYQSFVNFVMRKVNTRFIGTELAFEYAVTTMISCNAVASIGQAFYTGRPEVQVYNDNDTNTRAGGKNVYLKNYYLGVGPQSAYTTGITYNSKKYWYVKINGNYLDRNYVAVNPARRSTEALGLIDQNNPLFGRILDQEKLPVILTVDISGGKSFRLSRLTKRFSYGTMLYCNFGMSNIMNNRTIKSSGFEQLRYDFTNNNPDKFPTKYTYGYGRNFFANLGLKF